MLETAEIPDTKIYITNIVKYRPPSNRDPSSQEKKACLQFLLREINLIKPKIIAPLGRHSMDFFLPEALISQVRGTKIIQKTDWNIKQIFFPLYHPAVGLYNPSKREVMQSDMYNLAKILKTI
jgi:DNA polymerase